MGYFRYFKYNHPLLNMIWQDPNDELAGFRRRTIILSVGLLAFTASILNSEIFFTDDSKEYSTTNDFEELGNGTVTDHFIVTLATGFALTIVNQILSFYFSLPERWCCKLPCCCWSRYVVYGNAVWLLLLNIALYVLLSSYNGEAFLGWFFAYLVYAGLVVPILITFWYYCLGGEEKEKLRDMEMQQLQGSGGITYAKAPESRSDDLRV